MRTSGEAGGLVCGEEETRGDAAGFGGFFGKPAPDHEKSLAVPVVEV
jgi:hypothetical protein